MSQMTNGAACPACELLHGKSAQGPWGSARQRGCFYAACCDLQGCCAQQGLARSVFMQKVKVCVALVSSATPEVQAL